MLTFGVRAELVVTELMYNPIGGIDYEFVELHNPGGPPVSLDGLHFSGIVYAFPNLQLEGGEYIVLAREPAVFATRYPGIPVFGDYSGKLNNDGEDLVIYDASSNVVFAVSYDDAGDWPEGADGNGSSLVLIDHAEDPNDPFNWGASLRLHGTPGAPDAIAELDIVINEVLAHTDPPLEDAIELHNVSTNEVNVGGWYLSDSNARRKKFRIPDNTLIPSGGYAAFYEIDFNDATTNAFALSSLNGDEVYLSEADGLDEIIRFVDQVSFGPTENGESLGRFPNGSGKLTAMEEPTFGVNDPATIEFFRTGNGDANASPRIGPVVINEIMYHPPDLGLLDNTQDEYLELHNISPLPVALFDNGAVTNKEWRLSGAVDFTFPEDLVLQPNETILVIGTNDVAGFRARYGISTNVPVYGPWSGKLDNSSEDVVLERPDPHFGTNVVPFVEVDRVDYRDDSPWPTGADGLGVSLERVSSVSFGNDPLNWQNGPQGGSPGADNSAFIPPGAIVISEFMAQNETTLADVDGDFNDWIELTNTTTNDIPLAGFYLTDTETNLTQWVFAGLTLPAGQSIVVFASGKDRNNPSVQQHTNFRLGDTGEFLALVRPNGVTIEHAWSPVYPPQFADVSYGIPNQGTVSTNLLAEGASGRYLVPTAPADVPASWADRSFNDAAWDPAVTGIGYEDGTGYEADITTDLLAEMNDTMASVYLRLPFQYSPIGTPLSMTLRMKYDDGFVAYLNGVELAAANAPAAPRDWDAEATASHSDAAAVVYQSFDLAPGLNELVNGANVLAIHGLNVAINSSDFLLVPELDLFRAPATGGGSAAYFQPATPGLANGSGFPGVAATPVFSHPGGVITNAFDLDITTTETNGVIRVTLDGSTPTESSPAYAGPIPVSSETEVRARVFVPGLASSAIVSALYRETFLGINEIMASNGSTISDMVDFSDFADWIELYNDGPDTVDLGGWFLSDDRADRFLWQIPAGTSIASKGHLLIWTDGEDQRPGVSLTRPYWPFDRFTTQNYHTNFRLSSSGEEIGLYQPNGTQVDRVEFDNQQRDVSLGRFPDGSTDLRYFGEATPAATNLPPVLLSNTAFTGEVDFSLTGGFYATTQSLALSHGSPGSEIRYTLDGSRPHRASLRYAGPLSIASNTVVRARAFETGLLPGPIESEGYFIDERQYALPVVSFIADPFDLFDNARGIYDNNFKQREIPGHMEYFETQDARQLDLDLGMRIFGLNIFRFPQKPFSMFLRGRYGTEELGYQLFKEKQIGNYSRFIFRNSGDDWPESYFRDALMQQIIVGHMDNGYQAYQPVVAFLNGEYFGLLNGREKLDESFIPVNYGIAQEDIDFWEMDGAGNGAVPSVTQGDALAWETLLNYAQVNNLADPVHYAFVRDQLNVEDIADFVILQSFYSNTSWFHNRKWWRERGTGKWRWLVFDLDRGFHANVLGANELFDMAGRFDIFEELVDSPEFKDYFVQRYAGHLNSTFQSARMLDLIDQTAARLEPELQDHIDRWGGGISSMTSWNNEVNEIRSFATQRPAIAASQLAAFAGSAAANLVMNDNGGGTILANRVVLDSGVRTNQFFQGIPVNLEAVADIGQQFVRWELTGASLTTNILAAGAEWKYLDDGSNQGTAWKEPAFNDSTWEEGGAQLGYGDGDEATEISFGGVSNDKHITTYFRKSILLLNPGQYQSLELNLKRDDGGIVYLNGVEVARQNMPPGAITYTDTAASFVGVPDENFFFTTTISPTNLVTGFNVLAVEIHQGGPTSADLSFDLEINATLNPGQVTTNFNSVLSYTPTGSGGIAAIFEPTGDNLVPEITGNLVLGAAQSPWFATGDIIVPSNTTLTVEAGVDLFMPDEASILVYGELLMNGTPGNPVSVLSNPDPAARVPLYVDTNLTGSVEGPRWGGIAARSSTAPMQLHNVVLRDADQARDPVREKAAISGWDSELLLDGVDLDDVKFPIFVQHGPSTILRNSRIRTDEVSDLINVKHADFALVENNDLRGSTAVDTDAIDYDNISGGIIRGNDIYDFRGFNNDGIDIGEGAQNILIISNHIYNCNDKGISIGQGSSAIVRQNLIRDCDQGIGIKDAGSFVEVDRSTFDGNNFAIAAFEKNLGEGGGTAAIRGSIFTDSGSSSLFVDALSSITTSYSITDDLVYAGIGNRVGNPRYMNEAVTNFTLQAGSPAINRADPSSPLDPDGTRADMGAFAFSLDQGFVVITEIHYHPSQGLSNEFEYVELCNPGGTPVDVSGWFFEDGFEFTFPPGTSLATGEYVLVCAEPANYSSSGVRTFEWISGSLANEGERIRLVDANTNRMDLVDYDENLPWPTDADGLGPSLSLIHPMMDNRLPQSWRASAAHGGTPGIPSDSVMVSAAVHDAGADTLSVDVDLLPDLEYQLEFCTDLTQPVWTAIGNALMGTGPATLEADIPPGADKRYYRVRALYR